MTTQITASNFTPVLNATLTVPKITGIGYPGDDLAADTAGGQTIYITGTGFTAGVSVLLGTSPIITAPVVTVINSTSIAFTTPAAASGNYPVYVVNSDGATAITLPGIAYSGTPVWTTASGSITSVYETTAVNTTVTATGDAPITYALYSGSLPTNVTLNSTSGVLSGTSALTSNPTTYNFVVRATDPQKQDSDRSFSITINPDVVTWSSPADNTSYTTFLTLGIDAVTLAAASAAGQALTYTADTLPDGLSITGNHISGTPATVQNVTSVVTATSANTGKTATRTFTWSVFAGDPYFNNNVLLLQANNIPYNVDASSNKFVITQTGSVHGEPVTPFLGAGYYSGYFNGSTDNLSVPAGAFVFSTNSFTVEAWVNTSAYNISGNGGEMLIDNWAGAPSGSWVTNQWQIWITTAGVLKFEYATGASTTVSIGTGTVSLNTWTHIAVVRNSTTVTVYVNGVASGSGTVSQSLGVSAAGSIARQTNGSAYRYIGYISNARIVIGTAVYTTAFTPPTAPLTAISGTSLLTLQYNRFVDNSTNAFAVTATGTPSVKQFAPFSQPSGVSTYGSGYFNGTTDYLSAPVGSAAQFGTGDFTIECWFYWPGAAPVNTNQYTLITNIVASDNTTWDLQYYNGNFRFSSWSPTFITGTVPFVGNQWNHVAVTRSGTVGAIWLNGASIGTATGFSTNLSSSSPVKVGYGINNYFAGYISNIRIVKGTAVYTTAFTPPTVPLMEVSGTSLLTLQNNQSHNNSGFTDSSTINNVLTVHGTPIQGSLSPFSQTGWSGYFSGSTDCLNLPSSFAFGTNNFTIEAWIFLGKSTGSGIGASIFDKRGLYNTSTGIAFLVEGVGNFVGFRTNGNTLYLGSLSAPLNTWTHVALVKISGVIYLYVNGVLSTSLSYATSLTDTSAAIGRSTDSNASYYFNGYISNLRVINGTGLYSTAFTPPTSPLTAIANTSLLTLQDNKFKDNSTNAYSITTVGTPSIQPYTPFPPIKDYSTTACGGSTYFNGTTDWLYTAASNSFVFPGDFTIEAWVNFDAIGTNPQSIYGQISGTYFDVRWYGSSNQWQISLNGAAGTSLGGASSVQPKVWMHVAFVRSSGVIKLYLNGVATATTVTNSTSLGYNSVSPVIGNDSISAASNVFKGYISDLRIVNGTAVYTSNFAPPTSPVTAIPNTVLLFNSTNAAIYDATTKNSLITAGDTRVDPYVYKYGSGSICFDGAGDYLTIPANQNFVFGTGNFTVELWIRIVSIPGTSSALFDTRPASTNGAYPLLYISGTDMSIRYYVSSADRITGSVLSTNTWYHVAISRSSGTTTLFINGTQSGSTYADATNYIASNAFIGAGYSAGASITSYFNGYIDDLRVTKGVARYTSTFAPAETYLH